MLCEMNQMKKGLQDCWYFLGRNSMANLIQHLILAVGKKVTNAWIEPEHQH
jgi:hypothetical protein